MSNPCQEIMPDGTACKAYEAKGTGYCAGHARKRGLLTIEKKVSTRPIEVDEPGPLAALRQITVAMERGEGVDPVAATPTRQPTAALSWHYAPGLCPIGWSD